MYMKHMSKGKEGGVERKEIITMRIHMQISGDTTQGKSIRLGVMKMGGFLSNILALGLPLSY